MTESLGTALPAEMARVRDQVIPAYQEVGPAGAFTVHLMKVDIDAAAKALAEGDVVEMIRVYQELKGWEV